MPAYSSTNACYSVGPGHRRTIVNAESLGAGIYSERVAIADKDGGPLRPVVVTFTYSAAPASVQYDIYVAWDDISASYTNVATTTNVNGEQVTIQREGAGQINFRFLRVREVVVPTGQTATVAVRQ